MKSINKILIIIIILLFVTILFVKEMNQSNLFFGIFFIFMASLIVRNRIREPSLNKFQNKFNLGSLFPTHINKNTFSTVDLKFLIPYLPLILVGLLLIVKPYYLFPSGGDLDFHLVRAREILMNPLHGLFWDYLVYYPVGRALWHPPLFHTVLATLWYGGGVRFAHSAMCFLQILLSVGVVSWVANKKYGPYAGFLAGIFILCCPLPDTLNVIMPATFLSMLSILTMYYLPKNGKKSVILTVTGIWTHMLGSVLFLLFLVTEKGRVYLKNWKLMLPIILSLIFWITYWTYFTGQTGATNHITPSLFLYRWTNITGLLLLVILGVFGLYFMYNENKEDFKLYSSYLFLVVLIQFIFGDLSRGFQYAAFPLAILSSLCVIKLYKYIYNEHKPVLPYFLSLLILGIILSSASFIVPHLNERIGWNDLDIPFENKYADLNGLDTYINQNYNKNQAIWADSIIADKVAWVTGRTVSNGRYGAPSNFKNEKQDINIYASESYLTIKDSKNSTVKIITY